MTRIRIEDLPPDLRQQALEQLGERPAMSTKERARQQYRPAEGEAARHDEMLASRRLSRAETIRRQQAAGLRFAMRMTPRNTGLAEVDEALRLLALALEKLDAKEPKT